MQHKALLGETDSEKSCTPSFSLFDLHKGEGSLPGSATMGSQVFSYRADCTLLKPRVTSVCSCPIALYEVTFHRSLNIVGIW